MTADELKAWQARLGLTIPAAAKLLNDTPVRTYQDWIYGKNKIPNILELALREAERRLKAARKNEGETSGNEV